MFFDFLKYKISNIQGLFNYLRVAYIPGQEPFFSYTHVFSMLSKSKIDKTQRSHSEWFESSMHQCIENVPATLRFDLNQKSKGSLYTYSCNTLGATLHDSTVLPKNL